MPKVISQKSLSANRCNAAKSTGPSSPEGKARVAKNAIRHGLFAKEVVLTGTHLDESPRQFNALLTQFYNDFKPESALEIACVERMAAAAWRTRRAYKFEVAALRRASLMAAADSPLHHLPDEKSIDKLIRYESMLDREFARAYNQLLRYRNQAAQPPAGPPVANNQPIPQPATPIAQPGPGPQNENCENKAI